MKNTRITLSNINEYIGDLALDTRCFPTKIWDIFDKKSYDQFNNTTIIPLSLIICTKNQLTDPKFLSGEKPDPRQTAYNKMLDASKGILDKRGPITTTKNDDGTHTVIDGNATSQVLMIANWENIPVQVVGS